MEHQRHFSPSSSCNMSILLVTILMAAQFAHICDGAGGIAEMKAMTGDAPYMGTGNHEQAPEYFGEAAMRQYYQNPAYNDDYYGSRYSRNYYRSMPYRNYYNGGGGFGGGPFQAYAPLYRSSAVLPFSSPLVPSTSLYGGASSPFGGGFYSGRGNDWAN